MEPLEEKPNYSLQDLYKNNKEDRIPYDFNPKTLVQPNGGQEGVASSRSDINEFDFPIFNQPWEEEVRAQNQSTPGLIGKALVNTATDAALGSLEGAGYLLDLPGIVNSVAGTETEWGNWFSDLMKQGKEATKLPIYRTEFSNELGGFNPLSLTWWADNAPSIGSAVSLMAPALAATKLLGNAAKLTGISKLAKNANTVRIAEGLSSALLSRHMENTMEAYQVGADLEKDLRAIVDPNGNPVYNDDQINEAKVEASQSNYYRNAVFALSDFMQYGLLNRSFNFARASMKENLLSNALLEGPVEEGGQFINTEESKRAGLSKIGIKDDSSFSDRLLNNYLQNGEFWTSATIGALGGSAFTAVNNRLIDINDRSNEQSRAALKGDRQRFYDMSDEDFINLATRHAQSGTLHKLETDLKSIKDTDKEEVANIEGNPDKFKNKVQERLADLQFVEDTHNAIENSLEKDSDIKNAKLVAKISQRLDEKRLRNINTDINKNIADVTTSLGLDMQTTNLKRILLDIKAIQKIPGYNKNENLKALLNEKKALLPELYSAVQTVNPKFTSKGLIDDFIAHSNDTDTIEKLKSKFNIEQRLYETKELDKKIESDKGKKEVKETIDRAFVKQLKSVLEQPEMQNEDPLIKALLSDRVQKNPEAVRIVTNKLNQIKEQKAAELRNQQIEEVKQETNIPDIEAKDAKQTLAERFSNPEVMQKDLAEINEKLSSLEGSPTIETQDPVEAIDALKQISKFTDIIKDHYSSIIDSKELIQEVQNIQGNDTIDIVEVPTYNRDIEQELIIVNEASSPFKVAYFDLNKPEQWWMSKPTELEEGTKLTFKIVELNPEARAKELIRQSKETDSFTKNNPWALTPIGIFDNQNRQIGFVEAVRNQEQSKANFEVTKLRKEISLTNDLEAIVAKKGPGIFNTVRDKNFTDKTEKLHETLQVEDYRFYLGYGIGSTITVPNNKLYSSQIGTNKATDGAIYIALQAADKTIKPARALLRNLNEIESNYIIELLKTITPDNYKQVSEKINEITYEGPKNGTNYKELYFNTTPTELEYFDSTIGSNIRVGYDSLDENAVKQFLSTKRRSVQANKLNTFDRYTDPITETVYENGYNEFLSEQYIVTSDLVAGAPFRQASIYYTKPVSIDKPMAPEVVKTDEAVVQAKKTRGPSKLNPLRRSTIESIDPNYKIWDRKQSEDWFKKNLSQVDIDVLPNLKEVYSNGGENAWGLFYNSMIYLKDNAPEGTQYHEAFHAVFNLFLSEKERQEIFKLEKDEEKLAKDFAAYVLTQQATGKTLPNKIANFFKKLYQTLKHVLNRPFTISELFYRIDQGIYNKSNVKFNDTNPPKFSLHPSFSIPAQRDAIESINYRFFEELQSIAESIESKTGEKIDINTILTTNQYPIDSIYDTIFVELSEWAKEEPVVQIIVDNFYDKDVNGFNIEGLSNKHKQYLALYGYNIRTNKINQEAESDDLNPILTVDEESTQRENWMFNYFEVSGMDKLSSNMKRFIGLTREVTDKFDEETQSYEPKFNMYGEFKLVNLYETYAYLVRNLAGIQTFDDMLIQLQELSQINPNLYEIYNRLAESSIDLQSEFFTNFSKDNLKFVSLTYTETLDDSDNINRSYRVFDSNRRSLKNVILQDWYNKFKDNNVFYNTKGQELFKGTVVKIKDDFDDLAEVITKSKSLTDEIVNKTENVLKQLGIQIDSKAFDFFKFDITERGVKVLGYSKFKDYILGNGKPTLETIVKSVNRGINPFTEETSAVNAFVQLNINYQRDITEDSFKNVENKTVYSFNNNNFLSRLVANIKGDNHKSFLSPYLRSAFNKDSIWLNKLMNNEALRSEFDVVVLDGLRKQETGAEGIKFSDMTSKEALLTKFNLFLNGGNKFAYYAMPTPADNPLLRFIKFDRSDPARLLDDIVGVFKSEFLRIKEAEKQVQDVIDGKISEDKLVKNYHFQPKSAKTDMDGNAFTFQYITIPSLDKYKSFKELLPEDLKEIRNDIKKWLKTQENIVKNDLIAKGILEINKDLISQKQIITNKLLDTKGLTRFQNVEDVIISYFANSLIANVEITRLGLGDLAYYKKDDGLPTTTVDSAKRTPEMTAPGEDLNTEEYKTYTMAVLKTKKVNTPLYKGVDETDAQGYCTLDRYLKILKYSGRWNSKIEKAVDDLQNGIITSENQEIILNPLKPFVFGHNFDNNMVIPIQVKYSMVPLIPALTKNRPQLDSLRKAMESQGIDEVVFDSAIKVGQTVANDFDTELDSLHQYVMSNDNWRWQQNVPEHHLDSENLYGSQIRRLITANLDNEGIYTVNGKDLSGKELKEIYQKIITDNVKSSLDNLLVDFNDVENLQKILLEEVATRKLGKQYEEALKLKEGRLIIPPTMTKKFESILLSLFKNRVMKQKIKGITAVQMSKFGFEDLKFVRDENGKILQAECLLPWWSTDPMPTEVPEDIREIVGYRIPTEGKNSMIPLKVVGFLPSSSGSTIVLPAEITAQMGSDFDVDKLYIMLPEYNEDFTKVEYDLNNIETTEQRNNALIDITRAILLNKKSFNELTKAGGFETLKELVSQVDTGSKDIRNYVNPNTQEYIREINQAGAQLIGLAANHNTNQPLAVESGFILNGGYVAFDERTEDRLNIEINYSGKLISDNLSEFLAAFVDNAKDPLANKLNISMFTFDIAALIVRTGYGLDTAAYFLSQPILKLFTNTYNNTDSTLSQSARVRQTEKQVRAIYVNYLKNKATKIKAGISSFETDDLLRMIKMTQEEKKNNPDYFVKQLQVLNTFLEYKELATGLSGAVSATRADALGLNPTLTANRLYLDKVNRSFRSNAIVNTENVFKEDSTYPSVKAFTEAISQANVSVGEYIPWDTISLINARNEIIMNNSKEADESFIEDINYHAMTYLMSDFPWLRLQDSRKKELLFGKDSVSNQLKTVKDKYPELIDDYFLRMLKSNTVKEGDLQDIIFINPLDKTGFERDLIIDSWEALLKDSREDVKQLAEDLILYNFFTTGLTKTFNSFFDYIPLTYLEDIGYIEYYSSQKDSLNIEGYLDMFVVQYLQNNSKTSDRIPELNELDVVNFKGNKVKPASIVTLAKDKFVNSEGKWTKVLTYNDNLYILQQFNEQGAVYSIIPKLGNGSTILEYKFNEIITESIIDSNNVPKTDIEDMINLEEYTETSLESSTKNDTFVSDEEVQKRIDECNGE